MKTKSWIGPASRCFSTDKLTGTKKMFLDVLCFISLCSLNRSCVQKISKASLNCTSALGQAAVCYCHDHFCNGAGRTSAMMGTVLAAILAFLAVRA